jgi:hypothetical protein
LGKCAVTLVEIKASWINGAVSQSHTDGAAATAQWLIIELGNAGNAQLILQVLPAPFAKQAPCTHTKRYVDQWKSNAYQCKSGWWKCRSNDMHTNRDHPQKNRCRNRKKIDRNRPSQVNPTIARRDHRHNDSNYPVSRRQA